MCSYAACGLQEVVGALSDELTLQLLHVTAPAYPHMLQGATDWWYACQYVRSWNSKAKESAVAQQVLSTIFDCPGASARLMQIDGIKEVC